MVVIDGQDKLQDGTKVNPTSQAPLDHKTRPQRHSLPATLATIRSFSPRPQTPRPAAGHSFRKSSMSPSRPFILRPVATTLLMVGMLLGRFRRLPRSCPFPRLPQVDYPTIQVQTFYPGASPDVMASSVTAPLERQFGQIPGLNQMTSTSSFGSSIITLQFDLDLNIDIAEQEVQASINGASNLLPQGLPNPPDLQQNQSRRLSDSHARAYVRFAAALQSRRSCRHHARAENFAAHRRRPRQHQRRPAARGAHSGQSHGARLLWH